MSPKDDGALNTAFPAPKEGLSTLDTILYAMSVAAYEVYNDRECILNEKPEKLECAPIRDSQGRTIKIPQVYIDQQCMKANAKATITQLHKTLSSAVESKGREVDFADRNVVHISPGYADDLYRITMARVPGKIRQLADPLVRKKAQADFARMGEDDRRMYFDQILVQIAQNECVLPLAQEM